MTLLRSTAGTVVLLTCAGLARAEPELSSTITATSDYDFRGITQTAQDPAIQGSLDLALDSGAYLGIWASNVDFGDDTASDVEIDLLGGYSGSINDDLGYDVGAVLYVYEDSDDDIDYMEVYGGLDYKILSTKLWISPDYLNSGDSAFYLEGNLEGGSLPFELGWIVHLGYSGGEFFSDSADNGLDEYYDWAVGLTRTFGRFDFELKWADGSDLDEADGTGSPPDANSSEGRLILSVSTTFPWSDE
ncbi:MAG: TorF family putative porin [Gammaproteobacteria bacterium]|nr:TorF family putative porin [Gammaproteobacteria bacterium]